MMYLFKPIKGVNMPIKVNHLTYLSETDQNQLQDTLLGFELDIWIGYT